MHIMPWNIIDKIIKEWRMYVNEYMSLRVYLNKDIEIFITSFIGKDHRFAPIVLRLLWLWRPLREWQCLPHLKQMKAVVGLLAGHTVFLWSLFSLLLVALFLHVCDSPSFTVCLQASLSVAATSQESMSVPSGWRSRLHTSWRVY